jgi:uncharacterized membrane protein (UPF0182 family)
MARVKRWIIILAGTFLVIGGLYVLFGVVFTDFLVDEWWFQSLGYGFYFWQRLLYRYLVFAAFTVLFFLVFFLNFWVASRFLGRTPLKENKPASWVNIRYQRLLEILRQRAFTFYLLFSLIIAVFVAFPLYRHWEDALLYVFAPPAGLRDPVYGIDVSYYLFSLPIYQLLLQELLVAVVFLFLGPALLYWRESRSLAGQGQHLPWGAKVHLSGLACLGFLIGAWFFILQRHNLVYDQSHLPLFFGPGYAEMRVVLPFIWLSIVFLLGVAVSLIFFIHTRKGLKVFLVSTTLFLLALGGLYSPFLPYVVQKYIVAPNRFAREKPFITHSIQATLAAYDLTGVETRDYPISDIPWDFRAPKVQALLRNIPVWDKEPLLDVFKETQELRTYYEFNSMDVDRYMVNGVYQQVFLAPRELNLQKLPEGARNWVNERLKYTHGYGVAMIPAAQQGDAPMTWFIHDIPLRSNHGFRIEQPEVYHGLEMGRPVIVPSESKEICYPENDTNVVGDCPDRGGVSISSFFRRLIFAIYFKEKEVFFTTQTNAKSRMLFRRNIAERIKTLTPFFILDKDPYIVVTSKRLYWIQDAYTVSNRYPYSQPYNDRTNYIRNSVKIVVDALDGTVDYYLADPRDPIIQAYSRIYPGLLKDLERMPAELKHHIRYPKEMFDIQLSIYAKYHQTDPEVFFKQADLWEFSTVPSNGVMTRMEPRYLTLDILTKEKNEFLLLCPMNPKAQTNLRALCVAGCDGPRYGKIVVFSFPKGVLVHGPQQVEAFINQDTTISQQLTLWNQQGSEVNRGKMITLPIGEAIVYVQPVYLKATGGVKIPQLKRLILSKGEAVVMEPSLEQGLEALDRRIRATTGRARGFEPQSP